MNQSNMDLSVFRVYSRGVAAENISFGTRVLEVWLQEKSPALDGDLTADVTNITATGVNGEGASFSQNVDTSATVQAEWLSFNSNRPYPPLVRRGERLIIWRNADTDKYFWQEAGLDGNYRRGDIVCVSAVSTVVDKDTPLSHENSYWFEMDSLNGIIKLSTTNLNNELTNYVMELMTKTGNFKLEDGLGNSLSLSSADSTWKIINAEGSKLELKGIDTFLEMKGKLNVKALEATFDLEQNLNFNVGQTFSLQSMNATMKSEVTYNINSPDIGLAGNLSSSGENGGVGTASFNNQTTFGAKTTMIGGLNLDGIEMGEHIHDGQHGPTSKPRNG